MDRVGSPKHLSIASGNLPKSRGKRPITIRGTMHLQCGEHAEDRRLRSLVDEMIAWPNVEAGRCRAAVRICSLCNSAVAPSLKSRPFLSLARNLEEFCLVRRR